MATNEKVKSIPAPVIAHISATLTPFIPEFADPVKLFHLLQRAEAIAASGSSSPAVPPTPQLITVKHAAKIMGCCPRTILNWIRDGRLQCVRPTKQTVRITLAEIERLAETSREGRAAA